MVNDWVLAYKLKVITKDFVCTVVGDFYLQDVSVVVQSYLLGDFERKHGLKLVLLSLISCNLTSDEIDLGLCRTELIWIDIFVVAKELVKLLREIQGWIIHIYLHLILVRMFYSESKDEADLFLWTKLRNCFLNEKCFFRRWSLSFLLLYSHNCTFDFQLFKIIGCTWVLNSE